MVEPEHHARVYVSCAAHAFAEGECGLVDHLAHDAAEHQSGRIAHPLDVLAQRREEAFSPRRRQR